MLNRDGTRDGVYVTYEKSTITECEEICRLNSNCVAIEFTKPILEQEFGICEMHTLDVRYTDPTNCYRKLTSDEK